MRPCLQFCLIYVWRLFFYSNEGAEPIHVHAQKASLEYKYWLLIEEVEIREAFSFNLSPGAKKKLRRLYTSILTWSLNHGIIILINNIMIATQNIESLTFDQNFMCLQVDGKEFRILLNKVSQKLDAASKIQRNLFTFSPSGYGIHWPLIDEDLSIDFLLEVA